MEPDDAGLAALSGLEDQVRRRLYQFVASRGEPVGRDEAAAAVSIGRPLAAYHLDKLVELGLLDASFQRPAGRRGPGAGRPAKFYARSEQEFTVTVPPRDYELAARLLAAAIESDPSGAGRAALQQVAWKFGADAGHRARDSDGRDGDAGGSGYRHRPGSLAGPPWRVRWGPAATSRGGARTTSSGCGTARSTSWRPSTATWCAA